MTLDNDTRGWIMAGISGVACVAGAAIIYVDIIVRLFPGMRDFSIAESDAFLSASLSLSFGVMLYSALYSMLPQSKKYLEDGGFSPRAASYLLIGLFLGGVIGIRILSAVLHKFIPSHVVDCDHTHDEEEAKTSGETEEHQHPNGRLGRPRNTGPDDAETDDSTENTPLLSRTSSLPTESTQINPGPESTLGTATRGDNYVTAPTSRRASMFPRMLSRTITKYVMNRKEECDEGGPCMGYSDPCGQECFKGVQRRGTSTPVHAASGHVAPSWQRMPSDYRFAPVPPQDEESLQNNNNTALTPQNHERSRSTADAHTRKSASRSRSATHHLHHPEGAHEDHTHTHKSGRRASVYSQEQSIATDHHHHVPTNAFMSIGLQTSLAIALHKAPEGFITYATNHANPTLGFAVFMALFIHNITEGFAMSLPLYLALNSRWKAITWSAFLGGLSQPLGAGVAALWFKIAAERGSGSPNEGVYGCMFAITAGVMTSVALSLYSESLQLSHNKGMCIAFAFIGMAILGLSYALTAN